MFLETIELDVVRGGRWMVREVDLEAAEGSLTAVLGGSGAGKSGLLDAIATGLGVRGGIVRLDGTEVQALDPIQRRALGIACAWQHPALFEGLSVRDHLALGAGGSQPGRGLKGRILTYMPELEGKERALATRLGRAERRMVDLARALAGAPRLLLVDELCLDLGVPRALELLGALKDDGHTVVAAERYPEPALEVADWAYVMARGRVIKQGPPALLAGDEEVADACVGELPLPEDAQDEPSPVRAERKLAG